MIDPKRDARQDLCIENWKIYGGRSVICAVTGFGKTAVATKAVNRYNKKYPQSLVTIIVPTTKLKEDWTKTIKDNHLINTEVFVLSGYANRLRDQKLFTDFLIVDEVHRILNEDAELFNLVLDRVSSGLFMGLSATLNENHLRFLTERNIPIADTITQEEAEREGYISKIRMFNLGLQLSDTDKAFYGKLHDQFNTSFAKFGNNFELAMACAISNIAKKKIKGTWNTGMGWKKYHAAKMGWIEGDSTHEYSPEKLSTYAQVFMYSMQMRKKFLYSADCKLDAIKEIVNKLNLKTIVFAQTTAFADSVVQCFDEGKALAYHSKKKNTDLKAFEEGDVQVLSTVKALNEGFNVEAIECAIRSSYTTSKIDITQQSGRASRKDYLNLNKIAYIISLYVKGTQEEKWLKESQRGMKNINWIENIEQLQ